MEHTHSLADVFREFGENVQQSQEEFIAQQEKQIEEAASITSADALRYAKLNIMGAMDYGVHEDYQGAMVRARVGHEFMELYDRLLTAERELHFEEVQRKVQEDRVKPRLGFATTQQLLQELSARGEIDQIPKLQNNAQAFLQNLGEDVLQRRSVDTGLQKSDDSGSAKAPVG